jgi:hypothetical protein
LDNTSLPATTTAQEDLTTHGQRKINLIWEYTQAVIALAVVIANLVVAVYQGVVLQSTAEFPGILSNTLFLIVGFYFSRTNHSQIGGVGYKPQPKYEGR